MQRFGLLILLTACGPNPPTTTTTVEATTSSTKTEIDMGQPTDGETPCTPTGVWCSDLATLCEQAMFKEVSPNFCAGLATVCEGGEVTREETCKGLVEQCEMNGAAIACDDFAAACACLAAAD